MAAPVHSPAIDDVAPAGGALSPVERHREWLVRVIAARTGSSDAVDDVLQEVALAVSKSARPPEGDGERPWLCTIAIRQCGLLLRGIARRARLLTRAGERIGSGDDRLRDDPIFWLLARETQSLVRQSLVALDQEERDMLTWKYVDGLTYPQIAARLHVATHVAEYRVVIAKRALRLRLIEQGLGEELA